MRFGQDLPDALTRDAVDLANLFQRLWVGAVEAVAAADDSGFPCRQIRQSAAQRVLLRSERQTPTCRPAPP